MICDEGEMTIQGVNVITFLLNQTLKRESDLSPNMTVLNYLRTEIKKPEPKKGAVRATAVLVLWF